MSDFLERHGTVLLLYSLVLMAFGTTVVLGYKMHMDVEKLFAFGAGFTGGAFSGLTVAMKVAGNGASKPVDVPPSVSSKVTPS